MGVLPIGVGTVVDGVCGVLGGYIQYGGEFSGKGIGANES